MSAADIAKQLGRHRTTVHSYLNSLELMGEVENQHGTWRIRTGEKTPKQLEKEITIELPIPKDQLQLTVQLELLAKYGELKNYPKVADIYRSILEKIRETRTITIKGKNVDDLDLDKIQNLILQANQEGSKINFKALLKKLKKSRLNDSLEIPIDNTNKREDSSQT